MALTAQIADKRLVSRGLGCSQNCGAKIWEGQPVIVLRQGNHVPYDARTLVFHASCVRATLPDISTPEATTMEQAIQDIVNVYHALGQRVG
jgi:hypothetical protein